MFKFLILLTLFYCCTAASIQSKTAVEQQKLREKPKGEDAPVVILKSIAEKKSDGSYIYAFEGADGIYREEVGVVKNAGTEDEEIEVSGVYRYLDANGEKVEVRYTADKNGFIPEGNNIPKEISGAARAGSIEAETLRNKA